MLGIMLLLVILTIVSFSTVSATYLSYLFLVYRNKRAIERYLKEVKPKSQLDINGLPEVSVIISTFEESKVIRRKLDNIENLDYPSEKIEVIIMDDNSQDRTTQIAEDALNELGLRGKVLKNSERIGLNESLNRAIQQASNDIVCITDADVIFDKGALKKSVEVLKKVVKAGGVTGKITPLFTKSSVSSLSEESYRRYYHQCMLSESSLHSAFPGNGPLIVFDKSVVHSALPKASGSSDGNIAMNVVKSGRRFLYVPDAVIYEPVPETFDQQRLQKVRRAKRLIQVFSSNKNVLFNSKYDKFGTIIFPLKFSMHVLCPVLMCIGFVSTIAFIFLSQNIILYSLLLLASLALFSASAISNSIKNSLFSFILHQLYLIAGLLSSLKKTAFWKKIERK